MRSKVTSTRTGLGSGTRWLRVVPARVWVAALPGAGVVALLLTFLPPGTLHFSNSMSLVWAFAVGTLLMWPRVWASMVLAAGVAVLLFFEDTRWPDLVLDALVAAAVVGLLDLWRGWGRHAGGAVGARLRRARRPSLARVAGGARRAAASTGHALLHGVRSALTTPVGGYGVPGHRMREAAREGQVLLGVVAAVLYGTAWLAAQWFYGSFGVRPEEVGVTAIDLLLASGVTALVIATGIFLVDLLWRQVRHPALRVPALGALGAAAGLWPEPGVAITVVCTVIGLAVGVYTSETDPVPIAHSRRWLPVTSGITLLVLVLMAFGTADEMEDEVARGAAATPSLLNIQIAALWAPTVRVWAVEGQSLPPELPPGACTHRLGGAGGTTVLLYAGRVVRLPTQNVVSSSARCD